MDYSVNKINELFKHYKKSRDSCKAEALRNMLNEEEDTFYTELEDPSRSNCMWTYKYEYIKPNKIWKVSAYEEGSGWPMITRHQLANLFNPWRESLISEEEFIMRVMK